MFFVFGRREKGVENVQVKSKTLGVSFLRLGGVPRAFYSPSTLYETTALVALLPVKLLNWG